MHRLRHLLFALTASLTLVAPSTANAASPVGMTIDANNACRHRAVYCGLIAGDAYKVRIARGYRKGRPHAQTQAWIDGAWHWLNVTPEGDVRTVDTDPDFEIREYTTLELYIDKVLGWSRDQRIIARYKRGELRDTVDAQTD
ncbi:hypothetical protein GGQ74_000783 [Desulfobaculum xiamenense]|uniref:Uncharacterized protein n=1 Tax=Desulfobaculum xiamenense TaxID=995050 RepID=A0A846QLR4_9BACT|nr:hypothetical protein [Desulfobaculum xiamenense]NJB67143.1 hypothetical protein [Desulfobaculum xiamenense]